MQTTTKDKTIKIYWTLDTLYRFIIYTSQQQNSIHKLVRDSFMFELCPNYEMQKVYHPQLNIFDIWMLPNTISVQLAISASEINVQVNKIISLYYSKHSIISTSKNWLIWRKFNTETEYKNFNILLKTHFFYLADLRQWCKED